MFCPVPLRSPTSLLPIPLLHHVAPWPTVVSVWDLDVRRVVFSLPPGMLMHSEILALTLQHARLHRCRSPACFSIPSHFLFLLNYLRPKSPVPLEGFHGRRLKSGSPCAFAIPLLFLSPSPIPPTTNLETRIFKPLKPSWHFPYKKHFDEIFISTWII